MTVTGVDGAVLLLARVLFGGVIVFNGINHFLNADEMAGYAQHKGLPAPNAAVLGSGGMLLLGGLSIVTGIFPILGAMAVALFLVAAAVTMHDFWAAPDDQQQQELTHFLKNVALAGGALAFAVLGSSVWAFSLDIRLF